MALVTRTLADPATYRRLVFLLSAIPLGLAWFVALVTLWSLGLGLLITPLVIPVAFALAFVTRGFAAVEAELARSLLDLELTALPALPTAHGFRARLRVLFGGEFWRAQAYLLIRWFAGFPVGIVVFGGLATAIGMIFAPAWVPFVHGGAHLGFWRPHTFLQSLVLIPLGVVLLPAVLLIVNPLAAAFRPLAETLLRAEQGPAPAPRTDSRRTLEVNTAAGAVVLGALILIWAVTSRGYFWPIWFALPLGVLLGIQGWLIRVDTHPELVARFRGSPTLARSTGVAVIVMGFFIAVWAITGHGYFWPVWPILALVVVLAALAAAALISSPNRSEMAERIETLETTRAGAVDLQDSELRRIERDLHDGAQARLVALGINLGMAEQKLADDPERAGQLLAEARAGAEHALRELRDLARGIHPPVLADRGLEAALASLAHATPIPVSVAVHLDERPSPAVETAAYFVAAEALANAAKHARARHVAIRMTQTGDRLELQVEDDGRGGANPNGTGMLGMRRRVEALDGRLLVTSPPGGPTTIMAELPCGS